MRLDSCKFLLVFSHFSVMHPPAAIPPSHGQPWGLVLISSHTLTPCRLTSYFSYPQLNQGGLLLQLQHHTFLNPSFVFAPFPCVQGTWALWSSITNEQPYQRFYTRDFKSLLICAKLASYCGLLAGTNSPLVSRFSSSLVALDPALVFLYYSQLACFFRCTIAISGQRKQQEET